jgi:hypothetical protein
MKSSFSYPLYCDLNAATSRVFDGILALQLFDATLTAQDVIETVRGDSVSGNFFEVLKVRPWHGLLSRDRRNVYTTRHHRGFAR